MSEPSADLDPASRAAVAAVQAARGRLADLADMPVSGHVEVFDQVHDVLQTTLAGLDER
ncbi:MAG TPA: hypothetical protein VNB94_00930 [Mycobacteriales bacterium]|nr:hypothetical protein [Mycobacteriales bacterium]